MGLIFILLCKINVEVNDGSSNDMENHPPNQNCVIEGGASNQVQRIIGHKLFLKSDINFIRQFYI
jgi:hypothetical protein